MNPIIPALHFFAGCTARKYFQRCRSRCLAIVLLIGIPALLGAPAVVGAADAHEAFFYEPGSGRRVTHYTLELPVNKEQRQSFLIPDDCDAAMQAINEGAARWGSIVDRRFWRKLEGDCRHHRILHRLPQRVIEDHVSGYDFMNAKLSDLPIDPRCIGPDQAGCNPLATDAFGMLLYFPLTQQVTAPPAGVECTQCEFKDGLLRGRIFSEEDSISCEAVPYGPSLRLIAVDFADINGDGFLDAVLRFIPVGPGSMRAPLTLPLTRFDDSEPFTVPETTLPPRPGSRER
jgi:hypothetical protein